MGVSDALCVTEVCSEFKGLALIFREAASPHVREKLPQKLYGGDLRYRKPAFLWIAIFDDFSKNSMVSGAQRIKRLPNPIL